MATQPKNIKYVCPFTFTGDQKEDQGACYTLVTKEDCFKFRQFADATDRYTLRCDRDGIVVWDRSNKGESLNQVKVFGTFDCPPETLYAVLQDPLYRCAWDESRTEGYPIVRLDERQEVCYYAAKAPVVGVSPRDLCNQRMWHRTGGEGPAKEFIIFNTGVTHPSLPDKGKGDCVRAISKVTGYFVQPWEGGCSLTYTTLLDPQGWIPSFVMNYITTKFAPRVIENLRKACAGYDEWLAKEAGGASVCTWEVEPSPWGEPAESLTQAAVRALWEGNKAQK